MTKSLWSAIVLFMAIVNMYCNVVITELLYDPLDTDSGFEWVELYNNGNADINLQGAKLQVAGSAFTTIYTFPHYILRAKRYVLIGEANIAQAVFTTTLGMQNALSETDGVRYVSADGSYTDTVLYGSPNVNSLRDDWGNISHSFAPVALAGYSLARIADGYDTHNCHADFIAEANPTPGLPNHVTLDYGFGDATVINSTEFYSFSTDIHNYSVADCDTVSITLNISLNNTVLHTYDIQPIYSGSFVQFSTLISITSQSVGLLKAELVLSNDANPSNNVWTLTLGSSQPNSLCVNEVMYNPGTNNQEWLELYVPSMVASEYNITITDAADNSAQITIPSSCPEYLVICKNKALLLSKYPDCPADNVLQVSSLPALNNEGDSIILKDQQGTVIDSMSYIGNANKRDYSLERYTIQDSIINWRYSYSESKATPGQVNSSPPPPSEMEHGKVKIIGSPFNPLAGQNMRLQYNFKDISNVINCFVYDINGHKVHTIASGLSIGNCGELIWNGKDRAAKALPRGIYILLVEVKDSSNRYFLRKQLTVVLATK